MKYKLIQFTPLVALFLLVVGLLFIYTGITLKQHEATTATQHATAAASNAQREINGNHSMLEAVCAAFRTRELAEANKWHALTVIERKYKKSNNALENTYHASRRKTMIAADKSGALNHHFDCLSGMESAYTQGAHSNAPQKATH